MHILYMHIGKNILDTTCIRIMHAMYTLNLYLFTHAILLPVLYRNATHCELQPPKGSEFYVLTYKNKYIQHYLK